MPPASAACSHSLVWDEGFLEYDFGPSHPFTERSRALAVELLEASGRPPEPHALHHIRSVLPASRKTLERFHSPDYLERLEEVSFAPDGRFLDRGDTPAFPGCFAASAHVVGGTLRALGQVLEGHTRHAANLAGGLHHASPGGASGFCILNDAAVAIREALETHRLQRVAYIDIDAHHGDGVMYGLYEDGRVLDIDFHQDGRTLFPGTGFVQETGRADGAGLKVNLPLPPGAGDEALIPLFARVVPPLLRTFRPELIVLQNGVDGHAGDPLAHLQYTMEGYHFIVRRLHELAHELSGGRLLQLGGGGYLAENVARVLASTTASLAGWELPKDPDTPLAESWRASFERRTGYPSPRLWGEGPPLNRSPWTHSRQESLVEEIQRALGVSLPAPPAPGPEAHR